jgi:hypothetical protein
VHVQATGLPMPTRAALVNDKEWHRSNLCSEVTPDFGTSFHLYGPMALVSTAVGALSAPHGRLAPWFRLDESSSANLSQCSTRKIMKSTIAPRATRLPPTTFRHRAATIYDVELPHFYLFSSRFPSTFGQNAQLELGIIAKLDNNSMGYFTSSPPRPRWVHDQAYFHNVISSSWRTLATRSCIFLAWMLKSRHTCRCTLPREIAMWIAHIAITLLSR